MADDCFERAPLLRGRARGAPLRVKLCTRGSRGDVQPMAAAGVALAAAGHDVTVVTEARHAAFVGTFGLPFVAIAGDVAGALEDPAFVRELPNMNVFRFLSAVPAWDRDRYPRGAVLASFVPALRDADVIVSGFLTFAETISIAELTHAAWVLLHLTPALVRTSEAPLPFLPVPCRCLNTWTYDISIRALWAGQRADVNEWRVRALGLPPIADAQGPIAYAERALVPALARADVWPPVLVAGPTVLCAHGRRPGDWAARIHLTGPFLPPPTAAAAVPAELVAFMSAADARPVVYVGFGSAPLAPRTLVRLAVALAGNARARVVVTAGYSRLFAARDEDAAECAALLRGAAGDVLALPSAPHDWLFPRVAAIVHSAGVGVASAALVSGTPQVPCPFATDQPATARALVALGVAPCVVRGGFGGFDARALAAAVRRVLDPGSERDALVAAAAAVGARVRAEAATALGDAVRVVEDAAQHRL